MIGVITGWFLKTPLGRAATGLLGAFAILWATYLAGKRKASQEASYEALEAYVKTKDRIDEVQPSPDRDAATERLRENGIIR